MDPTENRKIDVSKLSFIGLNTSELTWNDLHFGLQFPVEAPPEQLSTSAGRWEIDRASDEVMVFTAAEIGSAIARNANIVKEWLNRTLSEEKEGKLFQWLGIFTTIEYVGNKSLKMPIGKFDRSLPLGGRASLGLNATIGSINVVSNVIFDSGESTIAPELLAVLRKPESVPIANIIIDDIFFESGSLYKRFQAHIPTVTLGAMLLTPMLPFVTKEMEGHERIVELKRTAESSPAGKYAGYRYSRDEVEEMQDRMFNYEEKGISRLERSHRIANVQLALKIGLKTEIVIDGDAGTQTLENLKRFAQLHNCPANISNPFLRSALRQEIFVSRWVPF